MAGLCAIYRKELEDHFSSTRFTLLLTVILEDRVTDRDALIADIRAWVVRGGGDQLTDNILTFVAERTP